MWVKEKKRGMGSTLYPDAAEVSRKGGLAVSQDREHMREIGRRGGKSISENREHMSRIGKLGSIARAKGKEHAEGEEE